MGMQKLFREYDIRGIADTELTDSFAWALGCALADLLKKSGESSVFVGEDVRLSSPRLATALTAGLESRNIEVGRLVPGPTPLLYFASHAEQKKLASQSGIMVTGSHNPSEFNGFKMVVKELAIYGDAIQALIEPTQKYLLLAPEKIPGVKAETFDFSKDYKQFFKTNLKIKNPESIKVVVDAGNGAAGVAGVAAYRTLGLTVIPLFCEPDGRFPNHHPDPTIPKNLEALQKKVIEEKAQLGIAFDGDGDRVGVVTATGKILYGDQILLYLSKALLKEVPGATIISEVKSSQVLYDELARLGAKPICWKTGHSLIKAKLRETGAELAGEMSGHIFFKNRFFGYDDAIYAGARVIEAFSQSGEDLDTFLNSLPKVYNTPELRVDCSDDQKFPLVEKFVAAAKKEFGEANVLDIDGARINFPGHGWGLLRASNTQPVLVMRFEGKTPQDLENIKNSIGSLMKMTGINLKI